MKFNLLMRRLCAIALVATLAACGGGGSGGASGSDETTVVVSATSFSPVSAVPGTAIVVIGVGFSKVTSVSIGGVPAQFTAQSDTQLTVIVPAGISATKATVSLSGTGFSTQAPTQLVLDVPTLSSVSSGAVAVGGAISVTGTHLDAVKTFSVGGIGLAASAVTSTSATLTMPATPVSGAIVLTDGAGGTYTTSYQLSTYVPLLITSMSRTIAVVGDNIILQGAGLDAVTSVAFDNGAAAIISAKAATALTFVVPAQAYAVAGSTQPYMSKLTLTSDAEQLTSSATLTIGPSLIIDKTTATTDGTSTTVIVTGTNLSLVNGASVGSSTATIVSATDPVLTIVVPGQANGTVLLDTVYHDDAPAGAVSTSPSGVTAISPLDFAQVLERTGSDPSLRLTPARPALARAFISTTIAGAGNPGVSLVVSNGTTVLGTLSMGGPATLPANADIDDLSSTYNVTVPAAWMGAGVSFKVVLAGSTLPPVTTTPVVGGAAKLNLVLVPLTIGGVTATVPSIAQAHDSIARVYPFASDRIVVTTRSPYVVAGLSRLNSVADAIRALTDIEALRSQENPGAFFYGLIPNSVNGSGVNGIGYVGINGFEKQSPTSAIGHDVGALSFGVDPFGLQTPSWARVMMHEIGHNHSLHHAPCGGPASPDAQYPYAGGVLGPQAVYSSLYADDITIGAVSSPVTSAGTMTDLMGYCGGIFFSDYSYDKVQTFAEARTLALPAAAMARASSSAGDGPTGGYLVISGLLSANGVSFRPAYATSVSPVAFAPAVSGKTYTLRVTTDAGQTLNYPAMVNAIADADEGSAHFSRSIPNPGPITKIELLQGGAVLGSLTQAPAAQPHALSRGTRAASWSESNDALHLVWDSASEPHASIVHVAAGGARTVVSVQLDGGDALVNTKALPPGGRFEISFSSLTSARLVTLQR